MRCALARTLSADPKERLVGIFMAQGPSTRVQTRMLYKNLVYGALVK